MDQIKFNKMNVELFNDNLLGKLKQQEVKGLIVPDSKNYKTVTIIKGEGEGKNAYVLKHAGTDVEIEGEKYVVINKRDIILTV